ncbi:MAG: YihY/virulence factor BrkB family protein [Pseudomonadota bacterium]
MYAGAGGSRLERFDGPPESLPYHERLRGRAAKHPYEIGWRGWWDIVRRIIARIGVDNFGLITAGVTFYIFLALIPAAIAIVTIYGLVIDSATLASHVAFLDGILPQQSISWIAQEIQRIAEAHEKGVTWALSTSVALSLWAMNNAVVALFGAMNAAYRETEARSTIGLYLRCFTVTFAAIGFAVIVIGAIVVAPLLSPTQAAGATDGGRSTSGPVLFVVVVVCAVAIYRVGPSRRAARWSWILPGALAAAIGWITAATLLSWYLSNVANYAITYGSLGTIIALMFWLYSSVYIILVGAWLNAEAEHQTLVDTTIGEIKPLGSRGAVVADRVGRAANERNSPPNTSSGT